MIDASAAAAGAGKDTSDGPSRSMGFGNAAWGLTPTEMRLLGCGSAMLAMSARCAFGWAAAHRGSDGTDAAERGWRRRPAGRGLGGAGEKGVWGGRPGRGGVGAGGPGAAGGIGARDRGRRGAS